MADKKLFLLDAMALVYRAYYALVRSPRITSQGKNTNAQFGFTNTLVDLLKKENPTHIAVVWDTEAPTGRHENFLDYKANRQAAPEDFTEAIPDIKNIIHGFNIPCIELPGYEADDVIGALAWQASDKGYDVYMVTPDKDYGQLVRDNVYIYKPGYKGGTFDILGPKEVCEKWDIERVDQVVDILGLMGDAVDNIPGIPGVGEKTAAKLLKEYGTLENVLENADNIKGALGEKIRNGRESAIMSKMLATIITDAPIVLDETQFTYDPWDKEKLKQIFAALEFRTIGQRILGEEIFAPAKDTNAAKQNAAQASLFTEQELIPSTFKTIDDISVSYILVEDESAIASMLNAAATQREIALDTETTSIDAMQAELVGISLSWQSGSGYYIPLPVEKEATSRIIELLRPFLERKDVLWIGQNIKYDMLIFKNYGIELQAPYFDTMLASYSIAPDGKHGMDLLSRQYLHYDPISITSLIGPKGKGQLNMRDIPIENVKNYAIEDVDVTIQLKKVLEKKVAKEGVTELFEKVENPLAVVLADMEYEGVRIDKEFLKQYSAELEKSIKSAEIKAYEAAGRSFNLASPKQLGEILFDELKLSENAKKTKTGQYATGEDVLQKLKGKHDIIDSILTFREMSKLKSTYSDALPQMINPKTGRVHTNFAQSVVLSGRLSSNNPNLQNIPIRTELGREIRKAFISRDENHILFSADYSQIELRVMAAMSGDQGMIKAFQEKKDIHRATAAKVYGISDEEVDSTMRRNAKAVNFGLIYGQSAFGLSENLGISRAESKEIIDNYFREYASVKSYMDYLKESGRSNGYVTTIMGRKINLADINSSNHTLRGFAERLAINAPIQGSAADMIKLAMIQIRESFIKEKIKSKMILQVHDELVFDVVKEELEDVKNIVLQCMEHALQLPNDVPVVAECGSGHNWLDAH